jgi:hypothetical protein
MSIVIWMTPHTLHTKKEKDLECLDKDERILYCFLRGRKGKEYK